MNARKAKAIRKQAIKETLGMQYAAYCYANPTMHHQIVLVGNCTRKVIKQKKKALRA